MLDAPQKPIGIVENAHLGDRQQFELRDGAQSLQGSLLLQEGLMRAVDELQCLDDKLDLANAARTQFNV